MPFLVAWRITSLCDREVIDALVDPAHAGPSAELARALREWDGTYYWSDEPSGRWLVVSRSAAGRRERWWLHGALFLLTLVTTAVAGGALRGTTRVDETWGLLGGSLAFTGDPAWALTGGLVFSVPLVLILLAHELGHYVTARRYGLDVSPPYFLPVPLWPSFIGTMGAFIRLRTLLSDRRQLFDVGIAGPIAGFLVALPVLIAGVSLSHPELGREGVSGMVLVIGSDRLAIGDSPVTLVARWLAHGHLGPLVLHPLAFAGVLGMFVTMINLMPMAQLDGGHLLYAAAPRWHRRAALGFWLIVLGLGHWWPGWYVWAGLVLAVSRGRLGHPTVLEPARPLPPSRRALGWAAVALFILTFAPVPF
jgi:membrane-associated protease RseP (regulator of RpoE activity)